MLSVEGTLIAALENAGLEKCGNKNMAIVEWLN